MTAPSLQDPLLTWGVLSFVGPDSDSESGFDIQAMVGGTHFGNPVAVVEVVRSLLIDGALAAVTGWDNREAPIRLKLSANDGDKLAEAEAALVQQRNMERPPPLVYTPPANLSAACVFDVVVATLDLDTSDGWDLREINHGDVFYLLTLQCLPFVRAVEATVIPALPVPTDPEDEVWVDVDDCESTTGWTRESNATFLSGPQIPGPGLSVQVEGFIDNVNDYLRLVRTGSIPVPADHYLAVDVALSAPWNSVGNWVAYYDGAWHNPVAIGPGIGEAGSTRLFFADVGTITSLKIAFDWTALPNGYVSAVLDVYNVAYTDTIGSSSTTTSRQQSRLVTVPGSMPTQAQVRLYDATPAVLGDDILVYTSRSEVRPNLRTWIVDSEVEADDDDRISGARHTLATQTVIRIPASLLNLGTYALAACMDIDVDGTLGWSAKMTTLGGADTVGSELVVSGEVDLLATIGFRVLDLAALVLPIVEVEGSNYALELTLTGTVNMVLDEAWLFSLDDGALTWVEDFEDLTWIEIRSPELGAARPSVWGGRNALGTGAACIDWKCKSFGSHRFEPGLVHIFTICGISLKAQCQMELFPRFHSRVWGGETS